MNEKTEYVADYDKSCCNCGQSPVVTIKRGNEKPENTEMCGVCMFGEAACIDPDEW